MFVRNSFLLLLVGSLFNLALMGKLGYYQGGTVYWEARNPANPREVRGCSFFPQFHLLVYSPFWPSMPTTPHY